MQYEKRLIEGNFPCGQVGAETRRERSASNMLPPIYYLHVWWARRPLTPSRGAILGSILSADVDPEDFIMELGIRKYQANIEGVWMDVPEKLMSDNGYSLIYDQRLEKVVSNENKLRKILRDVTNVLLEKAPQLIDNEDFKILLDRTIPIENVSIAANSYVETRLVPANPVWFNNIINLCAEFDVRIPNLYGYDRAYRNKPSLSFENLTVLDATAGGGSIPFEALRLGCNVIANDLNPVASAIQKATIEYPSVYGKALVNYIDKYGEILENEVNVRLSNYYHFEKDEIDIQGFLYCREVTCPHCGERAPLLNAYALQKKTDGWMVIPQKDEFGKKKIRFVPVRLHKGKGPNGENPEDGTVKNGIGTCLHCGQIIDSEEIKKQAQGISEYGKWSDELYCVAYKKIVPKLDAEGQPIIVKSGANKGQVRMSEELFFREPVEADFEALNRAELALQENWERWEDMELIPTDVVPRGHKTAEPLRVGVNRWCDMFIPRQLLAHLTAMEVLREMIPQIMSELGSEKGCAIVHYLQYMLDKGIDYNSRQTRWEYTRSVIKGTFGRHDFSLKWTFGEMVYTGNNSGLKWGKEQIVKCYGELCDLLAHHNKNTITITNSTASSMDIEDGSVDVICFDPPYYNNVQYAELSDYFYVWQKRTFRYIYPEWFNRRLTNKDDEAVANPVRDGGTKEAEKVYEQRMSEIFAECRRVLKDNGIMTMMFTHKSQEAWETLTKALIVNGWIITAAFPVDSESGASIHQKDMAAAASSIFISCRKRSLENQEYSAWKGFGNDGVLPQLRKAVRDSLKEYESLKLNPVDEMVASYGSALKVLSENWPVMDGDEQVTPIKAMREASTIVAQYQLTRLTNGKLTVEDVHPEAGIALTMFGIYGNGYLAYDDALSLSRSLNIRLVNKSAGYNVDNESIGINEERTARNGRNEEFEGYFAPLIRKTNKLRLVLPEERAKKRLEEPQTEWDIMQGLIMAYRLGETPLANAYLEKHAQGREDKVKGVLRVWADGCGNEDLSKEAQRILFALK